MCVSMFEAEAISYYKLCLLKCPPTIKLQLNIIYSIKPVPSQLGNCVYVIKSEAEEMTKSTFSFALKDLSLGKSVGKC